MKKERKNSPIYNKIEIDKETNEPVIVEVDAKSLDNEFESQKTAKTGEDQGVPFFDENKNQSKISVKHYLGINDEKVSKRQRIFKNICSVLFLVFVVGVLVYTFYTDFFGKISGEKQIFSWEVLASTLSQTWSYSIYAIFSLCFCFFFKGLKLSVMCKQLTGKWRLLLCIRTGIVGHYYNSITPLAVGGQPFEIYHLTKHGIHGGPASAMPIAAYFTNQIGFVIVGIFSLLCYNSNAFYITTHFGDVFTSVVTAMASLGLILCFLAPSLIVLFSVFPSFCSKVVCGTIRLGHKLKLIKDPKATSYKALTSINNNSKCLKQIAKSPLPFIFGIFLSVLETLALCSIAYFVLRFFGFDIPNYVGGEINPYSDGMAEWVQVVAVCSILYNAISFIPTPGNSGAADLSFFNLFSKNIVIQGLAFPAMAVWRFLSFYSLIIIGFFYVRRFKKWEKKNHEKELLSASLSESDNQSIITEPMEDTEETN